MRSMDVGGYKHNYEGLFYKKFTYQMSISGTRMSTTQGSHESLMKIICFILFILVNSFEEEIPTFQCTCRYY